MENLETTTTQQLDNVQDAIDYFNFRVEDLKNDDIHYLNVMLNYIEDLEKQLNHSK